MKKLCLILSLLLCVSAAGCAGGKTAPAPKGPDSSRQEEAESEKAVRDLIEGFGRQLQNVSLLAPQKEAAAAMQEHYADYVAPELLEKWQSDPSSAPGREVSSPWPDRIEIRSLERLAGDSYEVQGDIIEVTSAESSGEAAAKRPITLSVQRIGKRWMIVDVTLGEYGSQGQTGQIVYENTQYGFTVTLPESWKGYSVLTGEWQGLSLAQGQEGKVIETGPQISIRHPKWTQQVPRQDIPIMVFTLAQWEGLQKEQFHIGAAPIGPSELARNSRYVLALPARYNFAFPEGYEEVETLLQSGAVKATEEFGGT